MMELTIKGTVYEFHYGFRFMKELDDKVQVPIDDIPGKKEKIGMRYEILQMLNGNVESLVTILHAANVGRNPRITRADLEDYIEDPETDIDGLFETVKDFLLTANVTKREVKKLTEAMEETKEKEQA